MNLGLKKRKEEMKILESKKTIRCICQNLSIENHNNCMVGFWFFLFFLSLTLWRKFPRIKTINCLICSFCTIREIKSKKFCENVRKTHNFSKRNFVMIPLLGCSNWQDGRKDGQDIINIVKAGKEVITKCLQISFLVAPNPQYSLS